MLNVYDINGLMFWNERQIALRNHFASHFAREIIAALQNINPAWRAYQIEAPILTPLNILNANYGKEDIYIQDGGKLALRPETTPGSYAYAQMMLANNSAKPPFVVWQVGKSFRREQDQVTKNMRLKEFYQQEFQCIYTADSACDYQSATQNSIVKMINEAVPGELRVLPSDRLPEYSERTIDIEIKIGEHFMELASISRRKDFPATFKTTQKDGKIVEKELKVLEIAIGLDRCVYAFEKAAAKL